MKVEMTIFKLCPWHRRCVQSVFNMDNPLCNLKCCVMQFYRSINNAYHITRQRK